MTSKTTLNFITDFKNSGLIDLFTSKYDIIMIWLTGSRAIDLAANESDYDVGVLIADHIEAPRDTGRMTIAKYKKDSDRTVHFRVNTVREIFSFSNNDPYGFYDYLGWAQFKLLKQEHLIYVNPQYEQLVSELAAKRSKVSHNAALAFLKAFKEPLAAIIANEDISEVNPKFVAYFMFCLSILTEQSFDRDLLATVKSTPFKELAEEIKLIVEKAAKNAFEYAELLQPPDLKFETFDLWW